MNKFEKFRGIEGTMILIFMNLFLFAITLMSGGTTGYNLMRLGGLYPPLVFGLHQYWRLLTAGLLHGSVTHVLMNCYSLWIVGRLIEPLFGKERIVGMYFLSSVLGFAVSMRFGSLDRVTIGASGAVYGLFAVVVLIAKLAPYHSGIRSISQQFMLLIILNFVMSIIMPGIDLFGHIGGFLGGVIAFYIFGYFKDNRKMQFILFALYLLVIWYLVFGSFYYL